MKNLFERLILISLKEKATDIHFTVSFNMCKCEMRGIKGFVDFNDEQLPNLFQYIKYCANLDLGNHVLPQSGTFSKLIDHKLYYFRFSCISTYQSQTAVLRILNNHPVLDVEHCSTKKSQNYLFKKWCHMKSGLIIFSGPTSSGKTTTLHTLLETIAKMKKLKVITLEDPIEIVSENYLQLQINEKMHFTYEDGIKQLLRHDPDVIMIGEIRDAACARMVYRAALSGHLVFSTLHAKSASEAVKRLNEFGLSNQMLSETLTSVVNQRLYPDAKRKERCCIYEILESQKLQEYLEIGQLPKNHKTIFDEIREAVEKGIIRQSDAKADLNDQ